MGCKFPGNSVIFGPISLRFRYIRVWNTGCRHIRTQNIGFRYFWIQNSEICHFRTRAIKKNSKFPGGGGEMADLGGTIVWVPCHFWNGIIDIKPYTIPLSCHSLNHPPHPPSSHTHQRTFWQTKFALINKKEHKIVYFWNIERKRTKKEHFNWLRNSVELEKQTIR